MTAACLILRLQPQDTELAQLRRQVQDLTQRTRQLENEKRCSEELVAQLDDEKRCSEELVMQLIEQYGALNQEYHELLFDTRPLDSNEESGEGSPREYLSLISMW